MARPFTFDLESCRDLLLKMERELERLNGTDVRQEVIDHGFNFAVTAWHMTEWAWADMGDKHQLKLEIRKELGKPPSKLSRDDFQKYVCEKSKPIDYCRVIATASKHLGVDHPSEFEAITSAKPTGPVLVSGEFGLSIDARATLKIVVDGERLPAIDIFELALAYWTTFIHENQIA